MGLLKKYKDWKTRRWLDKLRGGLLMLKNEINFDPRYALNIDDVDNAAAFTRRLEEYRIWFMGNSRLLRMLYANSIKSECLNYFWYAAENNTRMLHSGIPGLISSKMATILFGGGINVEAVVYKDDGEEIDDVKTEQAQDIINNLISIMDVANKFTYGAQTESWGCHIFAKLSHKVPLSNYPILEFASIRDAEVIKDRGITIAIIFKYWYEHNQHKYRLDEIYSTNIDGDAMIGYRLYKLEADGKIAPADLDDIPQTSGLRYASDGTRRLNENDEFVYEGLKGMLAFEKPNKLPSHEFMNSIYGASDYEGALDSFDALDEAYSGLISELRDNKTIRYVPESMIPKIVRTDRNGNQFIESILPNQFVTNYVKVSSDEDQSTKNEIKIQQIPDKTEENLQKYRTALTTAINQAGLSPFALGITGLESISSSAESQQERNKVTLETRNHKLSLWKPFSENIFEMALKLNSWMQKNTTAKQDAFAQIELNFENLDVNVSFGDYIIDRVHDRIDIWGSAKSQGVASTYMAVSKIHKDLEEEQILEEVNRIRFEQGMAFDNPNNLPGLTGVEEEEEEDKDKDEIEQLEEDKDKNNESSDSSK